MSTCARTDEIHLDLRSTYLSPTFDRGCCADEFDQLAKQMPAHELVAKLAAAHWGEDAQVLDAVTRAESLRTGGKPVRCVATYYHRLGMGGIEQVLEELVQLWKGMGYRVVLICDEGTGSEERARNLGVEFELLPAFELSERGHYAARSEMLERIFNEYQVDALVYHQWICTTLAWDLLVARLCHVATAVFSHGSSRILTTYCQPKLLRFPSLYRHAQAIVCLGGEDEVFWSTFHERVFRTVNPVSEDFAPRPSEHWPEPSLLWVGRISTDKAPWEAFEVLAELRRSMPTARLKMVGPFGDLTESEAHARLKELGIEDAVDFLGEVAHEQLPELLAKADVYLLTSHAEGYCRTLAEAKAMGVACVSYDLSNLSMLEGHRGVLTAPIGDTAGLAVAARTLLEDDAQRAACGREGRQHMEELARFDRTGQWAEVLSVLAEAYDAPRVGMSVAWMMADSGLRSQGVQDDRDEKYEELLQEQGRVRDRDEALSAFEGSVSFRVGRALTAPLRGARDLFAGGKR